MRSSPTTPQVTSRDTTSAVLVVCAAVLVAGIVPLGAPVLVVALLVGGWGWRHSAPSSRGPRILLAGAAALALVIVFIAVFALAV